MLQRDFKQGENVEAESLTVARVARRSLRRISPRVALATVLVFVVLGAAMHAKASPWTELTRAVTRLKAPEMNIMSALRGDHDAGVFEVRPVSIDLAARPGDVDRSLLSALETLELQNRVQQQLDLFVRRATQPGSIDGISVSPNLLGTDFCRTVAATGWLPTGRAFEALTSETVAAIRQALAERGADGLVPYVERFDASVRVSHGECTGGTPVVAPPDQAQFVDRLMRYFSKVASSPIVVDLIVDSIPSDATFEIWADRKNANVRRFQTRTSRKNWYRGLYRYQIKKAGYRPFDGYWNLLDDPRASIRCVLAPADLDAGTSSSCEAVDP